MEFKFSYENKIPIIRDYNYKESYMGFWSTLFEYMNVAVYSNRVDDTHVFLKRRNEKGTSSYEKNLNLSVLNKTVIKDAGEGKFALPASSFMRDFVFNDDLIIHFEDFKKPILKGDMSDSRFLFLNIFRDSNTFTEHNKNFIVNNKSIFNSISREDWVSKLKSKSFLYMPEQDSWVYETNQVFITPDDMTEIMVHDKVLDYWSSDNLNLHNKSSGSLNVNEYGVGAKNIQNSLIVNEEVENLAPFLYVLDYEEAPDLSYLIKDLLYHNPLLQAEVPKNNLNHFEQVDSMYKKEHELLKSIVFNVFKDPNVRLEIIDMLATSAPLKPLDVFEVFNVYKVNLSNSNINEIVEPVLKERLLEKDEEYSVFKNKQGLLIANSINDNSFEKGIEMFIDDFLQGTPKAISRLKISEDFVGFYFNIALLQFMYDNISFKNPINTTDIAESYNAITPEDKKFDVQNTASGFGTNSIKLNMDKQDSEIEKSSDNKDLELSGDTVTEFLPAPMFLSDIISLLLDFKRVSYGEVPEDMKVITKHTKQSWYDSLNRYDKVVKDYKPFTEYSEFIWYPQVYKPLYIDPEESVATYSNEVFKMRPVTIREGESIASIKRFLDPDVHSGIFVYREDPVVNVGKLSWLETPSGKASRPLNTIDETMLFKPLPSLQFGEMTTSEKDLTKYMNYEDTSSNFKSKIASMVFEETMEFITKMGSTVSKEELLKTLDGKGYLEFGKFIVDFYLSKGFNESRIDSVWEYLSKGKNTSTISMSEVDFKKSLMNVVEQTYLERFMDKSYGGISVKDDDYFRDWFSKKVNSSSIISIYSKYISDIRKPIGLNAVYKFIVTHPRDTDYKQNEDINFSRGNSVFSVEEELVPFLYKPRPVYSETELMNFEIKEIQMKPRETYEDENGFFIEKLSDTKKVYTNGSVSFSMPKRSVIEEVFDENSFGFDIKRSIIEHNSEVSFKATSGLLKVFEDVDSYDIKPKIVYTEERLSLIIDKAKFDTHLEKHNINISDKVSRDIMVNENWIAKLTVPYDDFFESIPFSTDELIIPQEDFNYEVFKEDLVGQNGRPLNPVRVIDNQTFIAKRPIEHPLPMLKDIGREYVEIEASLMKYLIEVMYTIWQQNVFKFGAMDMRSATERLLEYTNLFIDLRIPEELSTQSKRTLQMFRWYGEYAILNHSEYKIKVDFKEYVAPLHLGVTGFNEILNNMKISNEKFVIETINKNLDCSAEFFIDNPLESVLSFNLVLSNGTADVYLNDIKLEEYTFTQIISIPLPLPMTGERNSVKIVFRNGVYGSMVLAGIKISDYSYDNVSAEYYPKQGLGNQAIDFMVKRATAFTFTVSSQEMQDEIQKLKDGNLAITELIDSLVEYFNLHHANKDKGKRLTIKQ